MENNFLKQMDDLYKNGQIEKVKDYIIESLQNAIASKDTALIITILNEAIGFYRDLNLYDDSLKFANSLNNIIKNNTNVINHKDKAICYINIANAYRQASYLDLALDFFTLASTQLVAANMKESYEMAALYNNMGLLYQQKNDHLKAIELFLDAYSLLDESRVYTIAATLTNLAGSYMETDNLKMAYKYLTQARNIYKEDDGDFHYMYFLMAMAKYYTKINDLNNASKYYNKALSYTLKTVGKTQLYFELLEEFKKVCQENAIKWHTTGLQLSKIFYEQYIKDFLSQLDDQQANNLACASFGFGSDKYKLDDEISEDHDFNPDLIILIFNEDRKLFDSILSFSKSLTKHFQRYYNSNGFVQIYYLKDFLNIIHLDFNNITNQAASLFLNGEIFFDPSRKILNLRNKLEVHKEYSNYEDVLKAILEFAQIAQYNVDRVLKRNDLPQAKYLMNKLIYKAYKLCCSLNMDYGIHDKWQLTYLKGLLYGDIFYEYICQMLNNDFDDQRRCTTIFIKKILNIAKNIDLIDKIDSFIIEDYKNLMIKRVEDFYNNYEMCQSILAYEWDMFHNAINIGKRADCQDDFEYFKVMRLSQFYTWNKELLQSYLNDLTTAKTKGYNLVSYKYGYMEESTDIESYNKIKSYLPVINEQRKNIQEEIIKIQLEMLQEFYQRYPKARDMMRITYSKDDSIENTSYETYLRGELSSYGDETLILYAKNIIKLSNENRNLVELTIKQTTRMLKIDLERLKV